MSTVWKYDLAIAGEIQALELPEGSTVLHVDNQQGRLVMWARVDATAPKVTRRFVVAGTGHPLPKGERLAHLGTALFHSDAFVIHVFEVLDA